MRSISASPTSPGPSGSWSRRSASPFSSAPRRASVFTFSGEEFLFHARAVLTEVEQIQRISEGGTTIQRFSLCAPRAGYISGAFTRFLAQLDSTRRMLVDYKETNSIGVLQSVLTGGFHLGILRYQIAVEPYFRHCFRSRACSPATSANLSIWQL